VRGKRPPLIVLVLGQKALLGPQETSQQGANNQSKMAFFPQRFSEMSVGEFLGEKAFCCFLPPHYSPFAAAAVPEIDLNQLQSIRND
jgi:hypothetical protein